MHGADADELERIATQFRTTANELDGEGYALTGILNRVSWLGDIATRYLDSWTGIQIPKIGMSTQFLRDAATSLDANACDQRATSSDSGVGGAGWVVELNKEAMARAARNAEIQAEFGPTLERMAGASVAEQAAWWNGLTDEQREALIWTTPIAVLALTALSPEDRERARNSYVSSIEDEIVTSSSYVEGRVEIDVYIASGEAGFEVTKTTFADGHVEVRFGADMGVGVNADVIKALADREVAGTYTFRSEAEYQEFMEGMLYKVADLKLENTGFEIAEYLFENGDHLMSVEIAAGTSVSVEGGVPGSAQAEVEVGFGVSAERNVRNDTTTLTASAHVDASVDLKSLGIEASGSIEVGGSVEFHGTQPRELTLSFDYEGSIAMDLFNDPTDSMGLGVGHSGTATISFDLTDPTIQAELGAAIDAMARGDVDAALASVAGLLDQGEVMIQRFAGVEAIDVNLDAYVAEASLSVGTNTAVSTYVKPPGSGFFEVK
jgi:hypothetical protein